MKISRLILASLTLSITLSIGGARADLVPDLSNYFQKQITTVESNVCREPTAPTDDTSMPLQDVNVDISPSVTFGINSVLSLSVSPEIDLVFVPKLAP